MKRLVSFALHQPLFILLGVILFIGGGIIAFNRELNAETAQAVSGQFVEVLMAPGFSTGARAVLAAKTNVRVLEIPLEQGVNRWDSKRVGGGAMAMASS